ncbi:FecR domain-containing protein [Pseudoxanthomonas sp. JBR18]|uniref:FecR family protein n=1 Tax=Pseudoxanthomonas sp. JBR18 TaxID=2969308 RepID=UPI002305E2E3|nr:FecR domain-containing protein [Pseudoxanthomonas sp. JBR18]WCE03601.1 FecR domain-containing protein [Pseudoxanthomonas sp. JBR18]
MNHTPRPSPRHARQALRWLLRQGSGEFGAHERRQLEAWLQADPRHRIAFEQEKSFLHKVDQARPVVLAALPDLAREAHTAARPTPRLRRWRSPALALATAAALGVVFVWSPAWWLAARSDMRTGAQPQSFTLEDGSEVFLDADSAMALRFDKSARDIELLRGRAWFNVSHEPRPFRVAALDGSVHDIGTAFSVVLEDDQVITAVSEGRVEVAAVPVGPWVQLGQGQQIRYRKGELMSSTPQAIATNDVAPWRQGEIVLDTVPARQAIAQIARYRRGPVWVIGSHGTDEPITAIFHTRSPNEAIQAVANQAGLTVRKLPGGALLLTAGLG